METPEIFIHPSEWKTGRYLEWYVDEPLVTQNTFLNRTPDQRPLPTFEESRDLLPQPHLPSHPEKVQAYWKAWELAFKNLRTPTPGSGFVSNYIDTAFNDCTFMWDSAFIVQFGRYGDRAFRFQGTLDNFYAHQHQDGFISREIRTTDGTEQWHRSCPFATGPNILAWAEWIHFQNFGDIERLREIYAPLAAYHLWTRKNRTWPNGTYWTNGLASGMDNMERVPAGCDPAMEHGWMTWTDATFQGILNARILAKMAKVIGRDDDIQAGPEAEHLTKWTNEHLWDEEEGFYFDCDRDGNPVAIKSVAAYWALLAEVVPEDRLDRFVAHLSDTKSFNRMHRVPTLAADAPKYVAVGGDYWCGAVWAPTNYMILRGLSETGQDSLAYEIAENHHDNILEVFKKTGTFWENYSPETAEPGHPSRRDFVGWTGLPPIAVFLEYILGLRPIDPLAGKLLWDIRLTEEFGVDHYPLGPEADVSLHCAARALETEEPQVTIQSNAPVEVEVIWRGGRMAVRT
jgi:hypothetical protein